MKASYYQAAADAFSSWAVSCAAQAPGLPLPVTAADPGKRRSARRWHKTWRQTHTQLLTGLHMLLHPLKVHMVLHLVLKACHVQPQLPGMLKQVLGLEVRRMGKQPRMRRLELTLRRCRFRRLSDQFGQRMRLALRKLAKCKSNLAAELRQQCSQCALRLDTRRAFKVALFNHRYWSTIRSLHVVDGLMGMQARIGPGPHGLLPFRLRRGPGCWLRTALRRQVRPAKNRQRLGSR